MDNLTKKQRSDCMSKITGKGTTPEKTVGQLLRRHRIRYRTNVKDLPGKPDIVLATRRKVIFVHGCFWHKHHCKKGKSTPMTRSEFWKTKRAGTRKRDLYVQQRLRR